MSRSLLLLSLFVARAAFAQSPPLSVNTLDGGFALPAGWEACPNQLGGVQLTPTPDGGVQLAAPPTPAERFIAGAETPRYVAFIRARDEGIDACRLVPVRVNADQEPEPRIERLPKETGVPERVAIPNSLLREFPQAVRGGRWLGGASLQCSWSGNLCIAPVQSGFEDKVAGALRTGDSTQLFQADGAAGADGGEQPATPAPRVVSLTVDPLNPGRIVLPAHLDICDPKTAVISGGSPKELNLPRSNLEVGKSVDVVVARQGTTCASDNGDGAKRETLRLHILRPLFSWNTLAGVGGVNVVALDWSPSAKHQLTVWIQSQTLALNPELAASVEVRFAQVSAVARQQEPCDRLNHRCRFEAVADVDWSQYLSFGLTFTPNFLPADPAGWRDVIEGATGKPLTEALGWQTVSTWLGPDASRPLVLPIPLPEKRKTLAELRWALEDPRARFLKPGNRACVPSGKSAVADCLMVERLPSGDASFAAVTFELPGPFKDHSTSRVFTAQPPFVDGVRLLARSTWAQSDAFLNLRLEQVACVYDYRQLTRAFAGLSRATVFFSVASSNQECLDATEWRVTPPDSNKELEISTSVEPESAPGSRLLRVSFSELPSASSGLPPPIQLKFQGALQLETEARMLQVEPLALPEFKGTIANALIAPDGLTGAAPPESFPPGPNELIPWTRESLLALGRPNWLHIQTSHADHWVLELAGNNAVPCYPTSQSPLGRPYLPFRSGLVCVTGTAASTEGPEVVGTLIGDIHAFELPGAGVPAFASSRLFALGSHSFRLPAPGALRLPFDLAENASLSCPTDDDADSEPVLLPHSPGARAVMAKYSQRCTARFRFPLSRYDQQAKLCKKVDPNEKPEEKTKRKQALRHALEWRGPVDPRIVIQVSADNGATYTTATVSNPGDSTLRVNGTARSLECDDDALIVTLDFDPLQGNRKDISKRQLMKVTLAQSADATAFRTELPGGTVRLTQYESHIRWVETGASVLCANPGADGFGGRFAWGVGLPLSFFRWNHTGYSAENSGKYRALEAASFGLGLMGAWEYYDFNAGQPSWAFNPQLQVGVFANSALDNPTRPRLSVAAGVGVKLPTALRVNSNLESGTSFSVWGELTPGQRGWQMGVLGGLNIQIGSQ